MKSILLSAFIAITAAAVFAQNNADNNAGGGRRGAPGGAPGAPGGMMAGMAGGMFGGDQFDMLTSMLQSPFLMQNALGLTDDQMAKLRQSLADIDAKIRAVDQTIQKLGLEQANLLVKALTDKEGEAEKELLALTDKVGASTLERARLRIQRLLVIKASLTPEQIEKAATLIKQRAKLQADLNKAVESNDQAEIQRLRNELRQLGGFGAGPGGNPGGFNRGGGNAPGGNNNNPGGGRQGGRGNRGGNAPGNNPGGNNNNANAPAPQGWN